MQHCAVAWAPKQLGLVLTGLSSYSHVNKLTWKNSSRICSKVHSAGL